MTFRLTFNWQPLVELYQNFHEVFVILNYASIINPLLMEKGVVYDNEYDYALCDANFQIKNKSSYFKYGADQNWELLWERIWILTLVGWIFRCLLKGKSKIIQRSSCQYCVIHSFDQWSYIWALIHSLKL